MGFAGRFAKRPYLEQFERAKRWQAALTDADASSDISREVDIIYAFFMNCYHLRDWLEKSEAIEKAKVDDFFKQNKEMRICRDLCNSSKHLVLSEPSFGKDPDLLGDEVTLFMEYNPINEHDFGIVVDYEKFKVLDLARRCIDLWTAFLDENKLI
jgi:hypothetical protein